MIDLILGYLTIGLVNGSFYALLSLGLALIFGLLNILNMTHGVLYMMGRFCGMGRFSISRIGLFRRADFRAAWCVAARHDPRTFVAASNLRPRSALRIHADVRRGDGRSGRLPGLFRFDRTSLRRAGLVIRRAGSRPSCIFLPTGFGSSRWPLSYA